MPMSKVGLVAALFLVNLSGLTAHGGLITDGSFENPQLGFGTSAYTPASVAWDFIGKAGLINNHPIWPTPPSVDGTQVAFLQDLVGLTGAEIKQSVAFPVAGTYQLTYYSAGRALGGSNGDSDLGGDLGFDLYIDNALIGTDSTSSGQPFTFKAFEFYIPTPMTANFRIVGTTRANNDSTAFFDSVQIAAVPEPASVAFITVGGLLIGWRRKQWMIKRLKS
jgi:hypothetical protein